ATSMMTRSICPARAACTPLAPLSADTASNSSCSDSCSTSASRSSASSSTIRILRTLDMGWSLAESVAPERRWGAIEHAGGKEQVVDAIGLAPLRANIRYKELMHHRSFRRLRVRPRPGNRSQGWLVVGGLTVPVALGRGGILANKREGDGGTPRGEFRL